MHPLGAHPKIDKKSPTLKPMEQISETDVSKLSRRIGFDLEDEECKRIADRIGRGIDRYEELNDITLQQASPDFELSDVTIEPGEESDPVNAFISTFRMEARSPSSRNLADCSVAVKDNIAVEGVPMTCGSRVFADVVPAQNATVVNRLLDAGARITGKTNMDELAFGLTGETSQFGPTRNPVDTSQVAGGSSGGSAAAVAEGLAEAALGSDTGGSVRLPAAMCGVVGFKPTWGVIPRFGFVEMAYTTDTIGPIARDIETAAMLMDVIAGDDRRDPVSARANRLASNNFETAMDETPPLDALTIGVPSEFFSDEVSQGVIEQVEQQIEQLGAAGATINHISMPAMERVISISKAIFYCEFAAFLAAYGLPIRRRVPCETQYQQAMAAAIESNGHEFGKTVHKNAIEGSYLLDNYGGFHYAQARNGVEALRSEFNSALAENDILATPTIPVTAPQLGEVSYDKYGSTVPITVNTRPISLAGLPAVTVPCGEVDGLPVGIQFIGDEFADVEVLQMGHRYEQFRDRQ